MRAAGVWENLYVLLRDERLVMVKFKRAVLFQVV